MCKPILALSCNAPVERGKPIDVSRYFAIAIFAALLGVFPLFSPQAEAAVVPGRIAVSADGNWHDVDDILASALTLGVLKVTGNASGLVFYGHSDHFWYSPSPSREQQMEDSVVETASRFGGFDLSKIYNVARQKDAALSALVAEINESSITNPLWLIAAGPMEFVAQAISESNPSKRQHVTVISHSAWNDTHAQDDKNSNATGSGFISGWTFNELGGTGVNLNHIKDQNGGLNNAYSNWYWLRDSSNANLRWLWCRSQNPRCLEFNDYSAGAGKSTFDISDTGMAYWLVTGGDQDGNPTKLKNLFLSGATDPAVMKVISFTLVNADTDEDIGPINNDAIIDLAALPTGNLNVRADTSPATVGSVVFAGVRTENFFPYALAGDTNGNYYAWTPSPGPLTITATPYSSSGGNGTEGQALTVNFTVIE